MTVREAARELGVSRTRVYRLIEKGRLRRIRATERAHGAGGRFITREMLLDRGDVAREKEARA